MSCIGLFPTGIDGSKFRSDDTVVGPKVLQGMVTTEAVIVLPCSDYSLYIEASFVPQKAVLIG